MVRGASEPSEPPAEPRSWPRLGSGPADVSGGGVMPPALAIGRTRARGLGWADRGNGSNTARDTTKSFLILPSDYFRDGH